MGKGKENNKKTKASPSLSNFNFGFKKSEKKKKESANEPNSPESPSMKRGSLPSKPTMETPEINEPRSVSHITSRKGVSQDQDFQSRLQKFMENEEEKSTSEVFWRESSFRFTSATKRNAKTKDHAEELHAFREFLLLLKKESEEDKTVASLEDVNLKISKLPPTPIPRNKLRKSHSEPVLHSWEVNWNTEVSTTSTKKAPEPLDERNRAYSEVEPWCKRNQEEREASHLVDAVKKAVKNAAPIERKHTITAFNAKEDDIKTDVVRGKVQIISGTVERLVFQLADDIATHENQMKDFIKVFFLTYRWFITGKELLTVLIKRYDWQCEDSEGLPQEIIDKIKETIQMRVIVVLKMWIEGYFKDFRVNSELMEDLINFVDNVILKSNKQKWGKMLKDTMERKYMEYYTSNLRLIANLIWDAQKPGSVKHMLNVEEQKDDTIVFKGNELLDWMKLELQVSQSDAEMLAKLLISDSLINKMKQSRTLGFDPKQIYLMKLPDNPDILKKVRGILEFPPGIIARELVLIEHQMFKEISLSELADCAWMDKEKKRELAPNIHKMISFSNNISLWVATEIISNPSTKKRVALLKHFIAMAWHCKKIHFYNGLFEIMLALNMTLIRRLKSVWQELSPRYIDAFLELEELTTPENNYHNYRIQLQSVRLGKEPILPYLGLFLKDLNYLNDRSPTKLKGTQHINFSKMTLISESLSVFVTCQESVFSFESVAALRTFLLKGRDVLDQKELHRLAME